MCELFGASLKKEINLKELLERFYSHSTMHPHGWGIYWEAQGEAYTHKEALKASDSDDLRFLMKHLPDTRVTLAHIRYATVGSLIPENAHPFVANDKSGRRWVLIHNGTIYSSTTLSKYLKLQKGDTDSERVFLCLLDKVNSAIERYGDLSKKKRFEIMTELTEELSYRNKLNLIIYDGELFYVHKNMKGTLYSKTDDNGTIFSTTALTDDGWESFPLCTLRAYRDGDLVLEAAPHKNVFIPALDYIKAMDAMNI